MGFMEELAQGSRVDDISGKRDTMEESVRESRANDISEKRDSEVGSMVELGGGSQVNYISEERENEVGSMEEPGRESEVDDILKEWDNMVDSVEEPGRESKVNFISEKQENKVGSVEAAGQDGRSSDISKKQEDEPMKWAISWNEAIRREHGYRKKMEKFLLQFPDSFELLPIQFQEQTLNPCTAGMKRKALASLSYGECSKSENKESLPQKRNNQVTTNVASLLGKSPSSVLGRPEVVYGQNPWPWLQFHWQRIAQEQIERIVTRHLFIQGAQLVKKYRCHICRVECPSPESLSKHQQGRRHKNQVELMIPERKKTARCEVLWCRNCNVPCYGVVSMRQHLQGKRHQASIKMQDVGTSKNVEVKHDVVNADSKPLSSELHQPDCSGTNIKETTSRSSTVTVEPTVPMVQSQRLRTSRWPNYL